MKHGKRPTAAQRKLLQKWKLNAGDWLVVKATPEQLVLVHRHFDGRTKVIPRRREEA